MPKNAEELKRFYIRLFALLTNLTDNIHNFVKVLLQIIAEDFAVDRLGIFVATLSNDPCEFILRGLLGDLKQDKIDNTYRFELDFSKSAIFINPTSGIGWDAYLAIRNDQCEIIALLAIDDTQRARKFSKEQKEILSHIRFFLEQIFKHRKIIEDFRFLDPLTGILNRRGLEWKSAEIEGNRKRFPHLPYSVAFIDIDHFGELNKKMGEPFGDIALLAFVSELQKKMRPDDIFARYGGEEFIIIWSQSADLMANRLNQMLEIFSALKISDGEKTDIGISFSGGVVNLLPNEKINAAIKRAVKLKKKAKEAGRSRILC